MRSILRAASSLVLLLGTACSQQATSLPAVAAPPGLQAATSLPTAIVTVIPAQPAATATPETATETRPPIATGSATPDASPVPSAGWVEYRDPAYGYGLAVPCSWTVYPTSGPALVASMTMSSYDEAYFLAHAIKGGWEDGSPPEGAYKIDMIVMEEIPTGQALADAARDRLSGEFSSVRVVNPLKIGANQAVSVITADPNHPEETFESLVFRLAADKILVMSAYPQEAWDSGDVQAILRSLVLTEDEAVIMPAGGPEAPIISLPERCE